MKKVDWRSPVSVPLWVWAIFWFLQLISAPNIFAALLAGFLLAAPFWGWYSYKEKEDE